MVTRDMKATPMRVVRLQVALMMLTGSTLVACGAAAPAARQDEVPTMAAMLSPPSTSDPIAGKYAFPAQIDPAGRYLFYLHGKIIEDQGLPAISPEFGEYKYLEILDSLASYGFVVISEQRPKGTDGWEYARRVARQVAELVSAEVPPGNITVVGASKGASIAAAVSYLVANSEVNYVLLGSCHPSLLEEWEQQGVTLSGNVLAIYDVADDEYSGSCEGLFSRSEGKGLGRRSEIVLQVGTGHGILYQPLSEWVVPTIRWANQEW